MAVPLKNLKQEKECDKVICWPPFLFIITVEGLGGLVKQVVQIGD